MMQAENKPYGSSLGMGISTILVFFVVLSLTTFATLSLVSANADKALSIKAVETSVNYYAADSKAEEMLALVDAELLKAAGEAGSGNAYYERCVQLAGEIDGVEAYLGENNIPDIRYTVPVSDTQDLIVVIGVNAPGDHVRYTLKTWKVVNTTDWDMDGGTLNLILG